jgi:DNA-binding CsgD family transcriptional regulator/pimeloyl-ACP methyl ester carboxylesterase
MDAPPVQYVKTSDGYDIAFTVCGEGPPYVRMPDQGSHVQLNWNVAIHSGWLEGLRDRFSLICYDGRGQGMSSRGLPDSFKLSDYISDLEAVVDALGLHDFVLDSSFLYSHVAIQFAVAHPERVRALILKNASLVTSGAPPSGVEMARENWEHFLLMLTGILPGEDRDAMVDFLRESVTQQDWLTIAEGIGTSDITELLPRLDVPTLILHARDFPGIRPEEASRLAAAIHGARLVLTEGSSYEVDPAQGLLAITSFLRDLPQERPPKPPATPALAGLSDRELEVLRLIAEGKSNPQIAEELFITRSTVQNHVSSILIKTNLQNRAQAAVYARDHGIV